MASLADITVDVQENLFGIPQVQRPPEDTLSTEVADASDVEWRFVTDTMWKRGDFAEPVDVDTHGVELVRLTEDHPSAADVTVRRGQRGTTAKAGTYAAGEAFYRNPPFPASLIQRHINEVIDGELWPHVWLRNERTLTWSTTDFTYDLAATDLDVEQVYQHDLGAMDGIHFLHDWEVLSQVSTTVSSNGVALRLRRVKDPEETVYYTAKTKPDSSAVTSLTDEMVAIVRWGAGAKCLASRLPTLDPARDRRDDPFRAYRQAYEMWRAEFFNLRKQLQLDLRKRLPPQRRYRPRRRRSF